MASVCLAQENVTFTTVRLKKEGNKDIKITFTAVASEFQTVVLQNSCQIFSINNCGENNWKDNLKNNGTLTALVNYLQMTCKKIAKQE